MRGIERKRSSRLDDDRVREVIIGDALAGGTTSGIHIRDDKDALGDEEHKAEGHGRNGRDEKVSSSAIDEDDEGEAHDGIQELNKGSSTANAGRSGTMRPRATSSSLSIPMDRLTRQTSAATVESILPVPSRLDSDHRAASDDPYTQQDPPASSSSSSGSPPQSRLRSVFSQIVHIISLFLTPITISLIVALVIALVPPLKALFVSNVEGWSGTRIRLAPDGRPALAFLQDVGLFFSL